MVQLPLSLVVNTWRKGNLNISFLLGIYSTSFSMNANSSINKEGWLLFSLLFPRVSFPVSATASHGHVCVPCVSFTDLFSEPCSWGDVTDVRAVPQRWVVNATVGLPRMPPPDSKNKTCGASRRHPMPQDLCSPDFLCCLLYSFTILCLSSESSYLTGGCVDLLLVPT